MITTNKSTTKTNTAQIVAGLLPNDSNIEFVGVKQTKTILWLQHGCAHRFQDLAAQNYQILWQYYHNDIGARAYLGNMPISLERQVELYIYYMCGDVDTTPDFVDGKLNFSENFRESKNCPSLQFDKKFITIEGIELTTREIRMIDFMKTDMPDKAIADELLNRNGLKGITQSTFNFHKHNLFTKVGVYSKTALLQKANTAKI